MLSQRIREDMKTAMKAGDKRRLGVIRLILAAIKQREVDERIELDDSQTLAVLDKMVKQRRESLEQYEKVQRELKEIREEIAALKEQLPHLEINLLDADASHSAALMPRSGFIRISRGPSWRKLKPRSASSRSEVRTAPSSRRATSWRKWAFTPITCASGRFRSPVRWRNSCASALVKLATLRAERSSLDLSWDDFHCSITLAEPREQRRQRQRAEHRGGEDDRGDEGHASQSRGHAKGTCWRPYPGQ